MLMAKLIRAVVGFFWLLAVLAIAFLVYSVVSSETDPQVVWGWMVLCGLTFCSATFLAYNAVFSVRHNPHEAED